MNKSPQYDQQQTEPKQCKSEVEGLRIHHQETGHCMQHLGIWIWHLKTNAISGFHVGENFSECRKYIYLRVDKLGSYMKQMSK